MSVVTISREFGAGGKTVGRMIANKLGYHFVDEEIIERVADLAHVSPDWVKAVENEAGGKLLKFITGLGPFRKSFVERALEGKKGYIDEIIYVELLEKIINQFADEGNVVIIGRGGQYFLADRKDTYHFFMVAEFEDRVRFMEEHYHLSHNQAVQVVTRQGKRREALYQKLGKRDFEEPKLYHMVFNISRVKLETVADIACALVQHNLARPNLVQHQGGSY